MITSVEKELNRATDHAYGTLSLQVVIIGVGSADFSSMSALDGDGKHLRSRNGQYASRDMYVPAIV